MSTLTALPDWGETAATIIGLVFLVIFLSMWVGIVIHYYIKCYKKERKEKETQAKFYQKMIDYIEQQEKDTKQ